MKLTKEKSHDRLIGTVQVFGKIQHDKSQSRNRARHNIALGNMCD